MGIDNILDEVKKLTDNEVIIVATHTHWDHIEGHKCFLAYAFRFISRNSFGVSLYLLLNVLLK